MGAVSAQAVLAPMRPLYGGGFLPAFTQLLVCYYVAGALLHWVVPALLPVQGIQPAARKRGVVARDAFYSLGPIAVKAAIWVVVEQLHRRGWALTYTGEVNTVPHALYCVLVVGVLDALHDAWFYWTHRLLHWGPLYKHVHYIHHKSTVPCAFTGYSFHVVEALIVFANEVLVCWVLPMHLGLHRLYHILTTCIHLGGHVGYEVAPFIPTLAGAVVLALRGWRHHEPALNTVQHHDMHHRFPRKHFSLYFTHWDRWCGTMHEGYDAQLFRYGGTPTAAGGSKQQHQAPLSVGGVAASGSSLAGSATASATRVKL